MSLVVRRAADRASTRSSTLESRHSLSFGSHYDPSDTHFGVLLAHNEDVIAPGGGYDTHPHRDTEIVTWVLSGRLTHVDSQGHRGVVGPGLVQRLSAGTGVRHSERNEHGEPLHLVQMWVAPDERGQPPEYEQRDLSGELDGGALVPVASGLARHAGGSALRLRQRSAALHAARLAPGARAALPVAPYLHVFVAAGWVELEAAGALELDGPPVLGRGDAARVSAGAPADTGEAYGVTAAAQGAELLVWEMHASL